MSAGPATEAIARERSLEAPHRRGGARPRLVERLAVLAYRGTAAALGALPPRPAGEVIGRFAQLSYLAWPTKRAWSNRNFGHVLGLPPDHPQVRGMALRAYRRYGHYLVELMRLPSRPPEEVQRIVPDLTAEDVSRVWQRDRGLILTTGHIGHNEAVAASVARLGLPMSVVGDDSSLPELFELLKRQRKSWGVTIVPWRNLREIYRVLRDREILGLLVDWGYRADGIPVRLFGSWTTLPAGPVVMAARTGARVLPVSTRLQPDGSYRVNFGEPIDVRTSDPAELQRATQTIADALAMAIAPAPEQWYSFKPIWPATDEEAADLERRALAMQAGEPDPGPT